MKILLSPLLVVEDSDADFEALSRILQRLAVQRPIYRCMDGDEVLDFIHQEGVYADPTSAPRPSIVLLDLNLPGTDGREVLKQLKQDAQFQSIPIVVFSTSENPKDVDFCYRHGANGYLVKPIKVDQFQQKVQAFIDYWLSANTPPENAWVELW